MFRHMSAIFRELEKKGNIMLLNIMYFGISIIPVRGMQYRVQCAGFVLLGSRELPEDGIPLPEHVAVLLFVVNCILLCEFCGYVLITPITNTLKKHKTLRLFPTVLNLIVM